MWVRQYYVIKKEKTCKKSDMFYMAMHFNRIVYLLLQDVKLIRRYWFRDVFDT